MMDERIVRHLIEALEASLEAEGEGGKVSADRVLSAMVAHMSHQGHGGAPEAKTKLVSLAPWQERRAKAFMLERLGEDIKLEDVANACGLSVQHFGRLFRLTTGVPPYRWLREQRIKKAREMLVETDLDLSDIALACGFANQSHFTRTFTTVTGISPGRWRRDYRQE